VDDERRRGVGSGQEGDDTPDLASSLRFLRRARRRRLALTPSAAPRSGVSRGRIEGGAGERRRAAPGAAARQIDVVALERLAIREALGVRWGELWETPLDEVRRRLGLDVRATEPD
jgi:hypothetical protein